MSQTSVKVLFFILLFIGATSSVHGQAACPPGTIPYGTGNDLSACGPDNREPLQQPTRPQPPPQQWQDHWGAIATYEPGGVLGMATNMPSESEAKQAALADCQAKGGGSNCKLERWYRNQCAALTVSDKGYNTTAAATVEQATQEGMRTCTNSGDTHCRTYYTACSLPQRIQ